MELKSLILDKITQAKQIKAAEIVKQTGFSRTYVNRSFQELRDEGKVVLLGKNKGAIYVLADKKNVERTKNQLLVLNRTWINKNVTEELVLEEIRRETGILANLRDNVENIFTYAFLEIVNNAIEHSHAPAFVIKVRRDNDLGIVSFVVADRGIGVFESIKEKFHLPDTLMAIQQLLKGKQTTDPEKHTGQGIFFTSKMADSFVIKSGGKRLHFRNVNDINDFSVGDSKVEEGTTIWFTLLLNNNKTAQEIFAEYTDKDTFEFSKTKVSVKLYEIGADLLSRSEARRIMVGLEKFQSIELDFKDVKTVGQSFADEIFRVWQNAHPDKKIIYKNANENVEFMIRRAVA